MGSSTQTRTQTVNVQGMGTQEAALQALMTQIVEDLGQQLDPQSLQRLLRGEMRVTPEDQAFIREISNLTGQIQRDQMQANYEDVSSTVEGGMLERGLEGSTIEAVSQALMGRELQRGLDAEALQGRVMGAQQLQEQAVQRSGLQLNANQMLLQSILAGASDVANRSLQERLNSADTTITQNAPMQWGKLAGQLVGTGVGFMVGGPAGAMAGSQLGSQVGGSANASFPTSDDWYTRMSGQTPTSSDWARYAGGPY